jgi:hypothetical protein
MEDSMRMRAIVGLACILALSIPGVVIAQEEKKAAEPGGENQPGSEQSKEKSEKVATKPPLSTHEWIEMMMEPLVIPKNDIIRLGGGYAHPHKAAPWKMRIIKEDDENVWLQFPPPEDPESMLHKFWKQSEDEQLLLQLQRSIMPTARTVDFYKDIIPLPTVDSMSFASVDTGLPKSGRWQVGLAVADMNGDGVDDLVAPPQRKGRARPSIFLGKGDGTFSLWNAVRWSPKVPYEYGGVAIGDFDRDGNNDVVFALHLKNQYVVYGNGEGDFSRSERLPSRDPRLASRAVDVGDFNNDGWPDLLFIAELSVDLATAQMMPVKTTWILENLQGKGWRVFDEEFAPKLMADRIIAADADGDGLDDVIMSSNTKGWRVPLLVNRTEPEKWDFRVVTPESVLSDSVHTEVVVYREAERRGRGASLVATFIQSVVVPPLEHDGPAQPDSRFGLVWYDVTGRGDGLRLEAKPLVIPKDKLAYWRIAVGDFNNDGLPDVAAATKEGDLDLYLAQPGGEFVQERCPELAEDKVGTPYALVARDFTGDGVDDLLVMGATREKGASGGFRLWTPMVASQR